MAAKKPNPQDATIRNVKATNKKIRQLEAKVRALRKLVKELTNS